MIFIIKKLSYKPSKIRDNHLMKNCYMGWRKDAGRKMQDTGYRIQDTGYRIQNHYRRVTSIIKHDPSILHHVSCILNPASISLLRINLK